jgi:hypothetical protein
VDAIDQICPPMSGEHASHEQVPADATLGGNKSVKEVGELGSFKRGPVI